MSTLSASAPAAVFHAMRPLLFTVAYEITGSASEADDVVQDAFLRWSEVDHGEVRDARAYLVQVVTRQALNRLRTIRRRREDYVGTWLPEPLLTSEDALEDAQLSESVSLAMMVVLDSLTPLQRAVFVLREVFEFRHEEIAETLGKSAAAIRQIAHRARERVRERRPPLRPPTAREVEVARKFMEASATGDVQGLLALLAPDAVLLSDGGGKKRAALLPLRGPAAICRFVTGVRPLIEGELRLEYRMVNAMPAALVYVDDALDSVVILELGADEIRRIYFVRNPDKLRGLHEPRRLSRRPSSKPSEPPPSIA
jgi:RNA polymerase sigma-70 factor (ECF subfamily)